MAAIRYFRAVATAIMANISKINTPKMTDKKKLKTTYFRSPNQMNSMIANLQKSHRQNQKWKTILENFNKAAICFNENCSLLLTLGRNENKQKVKKTNNECHLWRDVAKTPGLRLNAQRDKKTIGIKLCLLDESTSLKWPKLGRKSK